MRMAVKACLTAVAHLHAAKPLPICHCDVRLANVLWDPQPFLADLELAHFSPWQVIIQAYESANSSLLNAQAACFTTTKKAQPCSPVVSR